MTIHWCGTGLSSVPGLRRLIEAGHPVTVWNRTDEKAEAWVSKTGAGKAARAESAAIPPSGTSAIFRFGLTILLHFMPIGPRANRVRMSLWGTRWAGIWCCVPWPRK